jgi:hypothetical protein
MLFNAQEFQQLVEPGNRLVGCICSECGRKYQKFVWSDVCSNCLQTIYLTTVQGENADESRPVHQHVS